MRDLVRVIVWMVVDLFRSWAALEAEILTLRQQIKRSAANRSAEPKPPLRTPIQIAWTSSTLEQIAAGNAERGAFIALNCAACHSQLGESSSSLIPTLAGMDAAVIFKQLDDYRSGKRPWGVMAALAKALSAQDSADVATYFAAQAGGLPVLSGNRVPESGRSLWGRSAAWHLQTREQVSQNPVHPGRKRHPDAFPQLGAFKLRSMA
jgi:cytochrome c553